MQALFYILFMGYPRGQREQKVAMARACLHAKVPRWWHGHDGNRSCSACLSHLQVPPNGQMPVHPAWGGHIRPSRAASAFLAMGRTFATHPARLTSRPGTGRRGLQSLPAARRRRRRRPGAGLCPRTISDTTYDAGMIRAGSGSRNPCGSFRRAPIPAMPVVAPGPGTRHYTGPHSRWRTPLPSSARGRRKTRYEPALPVKCGLPLRSSCWPGLAATWYRSGRIGIQE